MRVAHPTLFLVCELPGAGKTTRARRLAAEVGAIRLCPDEWLGDLQVDLDEEEFRDRLERRSWGLAQELLTAGYSVVPESGILVALGPGRESGW